MWELAALAGAADTLWYHVVPVLEKYPKRLTQSAALRCEGWHSAQRASPFRKLTPVILALIRKQNRTGWPADNADNADNDDNADNGDKFNPEGDNESANLTECQVHTRAPTIMEKILERGLLKPGSGVATQR